MSKEKRSALTVFELLVILAILGFLLGLLLPILARMRQEAARMQSTNNMRQLGIACHSYNDTFGKLPAGNDKNNFSAHAHLLPFIEQTQIHQRIDFKQECTAPANARVANIRIATFISPNDPVAVRSGQLASNNYFFCAGSKPSLEKNNNGFFQNSQARIPNSFPDGTSNTIMLGESLIGDASARQDVRRAYVQLDKKALKNINQDTGVADFRAGRNIATNRGHGWIDGRFLQGTFTGTRKPNDPLPDVNCAGAGGLSSIRSLNDRINVGFMDGSVRQISTRLDLEIWHRLTDAADGNVIPKLD